MNNTKNTGNEKNSIPKLVPIIAIAVLMSLLALTTALLVPRLAGYSAKSESKGPTIVTTNFPGYDFARHVCGDKATVTMLLPPGSESHSYEPTAQDIIKIQKSLLFVYTGGESDAWVDGILSSMDEPVKAVKMMGAVEAVEEELKEGMQAEKEAKDLTPAEIGPEYDEHVWTSPANAVKIIKAITAALTEADGANKAAYEENSAAYIERIEKLDSDFRDFFATVKNKTLIFGDRFPLRYFVEEYGLDYFAAFPGCSADTEPSAATMAFLIDKVKADGIKTVFYIELSNHKAADTIAEATGAKTALFNTCHNVTKKQLDDGETYYSLMEGNLQTLREAMN